ncbi:hypothetical protein BDW59DRAFT_148926 [Aspergillus cavernicola]|uniref:Transcription factor domain-containing protein n=1 Tax=Aspergillus cavernicola TaxID=176166 RepID=A0ABR4I692_9EURO
MLGGSFREASTLRSDGHLRLSEAKWEAIPFLLILRILHGQTRAIPRKISLKTLAQVAILLDYYECYEAVEVFTHMWIRALETKLPTTYNDDTLRWLFISWVFDERTIFKTITAVIQANCMGVVESIGLPIPGAILDALNQGRSDCIGRIIDSLHDLFYGLVDGQFKCYYNELELVRTHCTYTVLGAFTTHIIRMQLLSPKPKSPFLGLGVNQLLTDCRSQMESPRHGDHKDCVLTTRIAKQLKPISAPVGLDIKREEFAAHRK